MNGTAFSTPHSLSSDKGRAEKEKIDGYVRFGSLVTPIQISHSCCTRDATSTVSLCVCPAPLGSHISILDSP